MKVQPTIRNILGFALVFQLYPTFLYLLVRLVNPEPKLWAVAAMFGLAQLVLVFIVLSWRRKAGIDVVDERELAIRLKVKSFMLDVSWLTLIFTFFVHVAVLREMPVWLIVTFTLISGLIAEQLGNRIFRKLEE